MQFLGEPACLSCRLPVEGARTESVNVLRKPLEGGAGISPDGDYKGVGVVSGVYGLPAVEHVLDEY